MEQIQMNSEQKQKEQKYMNELYVFFAVVIALLLILGWPRDNSDNTSKTETNINDKAALQKVLQEPKIKDAAITDAGVLYVQVFDDGTRRDGYASYLCELLRNDKTSVTRVKVVKVNSQNDPKRDNAYGILLGECWCK